MFAVLALLVVLIYGKILHPETEFVTVLTAIVSICCFVSWVIYFVVLYFFEASLEADMVSLFSFIAIANVGLSLAIGIGFQVYLRFAFDCDSGYSCWKDHD